MDILVLGGTRYVGVHLVRYLLAYGHKVTIATRGKTPDNFSDSVKRLFLDHTNAESIANTLDNKFYDVVYDSLAYCSSDIKNLLDTLKCGRYIQTSSLSVYPQYKENFTEDEFNPDSYPLIWCSRNEYGYDEIKRQAECALFQIYKKIPSVFPM